MDETTRTEILSILNTASQAIWNSLRASIPSVRVQCEHYQNPAFELRAFGTFSTDRDVVSLCLNVQSNGHSFHVVGDIYHEDGRPVRDVLDRWVDSEQMIVQLVREFVVECSRNVDVIAAALHP